MICVLGGISGGSGSFGDCYLQGDQGVELRWSGGAGTEERATEGLSASGSRLVELCSNPVSIIARAVTDCMLTVYPRLYHVLN